MTTFLISGSASGLGRSLRERFGGAGLTRQTPLSDWERLRREGAETIIHCAAASRRGVDLGSLERYLEDSLLLTERILSVPHRRFVFLSSVDVYPRAPGPHRESDIIMADQVSGLYAMTKLMSEAVVARRAEHPLILRCAALLGPQARRSTLIRMIEDEPCTVSLSADSSFNYILHEDVADFIALALERGLEGAYNAASAGNVTLAEVARLLGKRVAFGGHRYDAGDIDNSRIASACPTFRRSSRETVERFIRERRGVRP